MAERVDTALAALRAKLAELEVAVRSTGDADWRRETSAEHWPVGLVAFHIARGFQRQAEFIEAASRSRSRCTPRTRPKQPLSIIAPFGAASYQPSGFASRRFGPVIATNANGGSSR